MIDEEGNALEKFECDVCGCYFWVIDRNDFICPNCEAMEDEA